MTDPQTPPPGRLDIVVISDLRFPGGSSTSLAEELTAAAAGRYRTGLVHLVSPRLGRGLPVHPDIERLVDDGVTRFIPPGEHVQARLAIVKHPMVFAEWTGDGSRSRRGWCC